MVLFLLGTDIPKIVSQEFLKPIELCSSWITVGVTLCCGLFAAMMIAHYSLKTAVLVAMAYSSIFICYIGYVTLDFGASEPRLAAIGFNIATILQSLSIWQVAAIVRHKK